ncbi:MAG TPA: MFS transporter, partial [Pseudonocardiaceae bacterium]|nr:MFS transporter [Pseudonocardiaceae bacterium]
LIPDGGRHEGARNYDVVGAVLSTTALLLLVFTVVSAPQAGWGSVRTLVSFALVAVLVTAFVLVEQRVAHPLLRLGILRNRSVIAADIAAMVMFGSYIGFQFIGTLYLQSLLGWSPLSMALAFLPAGLIVAFGGPRAGALVNRFGAAPVVTAGLTSLALGYALFLRIDAHPNYPLLILPSMLLLGLGFALAFPALNIQATSGVADDEQGLASGLVQTAFQVGGAITLAVVTVVIGANTHGTTPAATLAGYRPGLVLVLGVALAGVVATAALGGLRSRTSRSKTN